MGDDDSSILPTLAGAAAFEGLPLVASPLLSDVPHGLAQLVMSGQPITSNFGTPLNRLAEFTRSEVDSLQDFARDRGVSVPIVASGPGFESGYFIDQKGPLEQLISKLTGSGEEIEDIVPHIGLSQSSVPHAMHEIGHAMPIFGSDEARHVFQSIGATLGHGSALGGLLRRGLVANALIPTGDDAGPVRQFAHDHAPELVAATLAPEVLEEGRASLNALRGAREFGPGILRTVGELAPAMGTYVASAAAPVLAAMLAKRIATALRARKLNQEDAKTAAAAAGAEVKAPGALRASASSAWNIGMNPPKPKTIGPSANIGAGAAQRAQAKPPSKTSYYKDMLGSLYNPQRGSRLATPTG